MEAVVGAFGLDVLGPLTSEEGSGMFRSEVVLSGKAGSNHIFGELSRISGPLSCPGWHDARIRLFSGRASEGAYEPRPMIFGRQVRWHRPVRGLGS